jgi:acetyl esterase
VSGPQLPEGAALLDRDVLAWLIGLPVASDPNASVAERRRIAAANQGLARERLDPALAPQDETDLHVDGPAGPIPIRIFTPPGGGPRPLIVFFHGGGWVIGDVDTHSGHARRLCVQANAVVVSVGYRLAPEHRFPAAYDDSVAATNWAADNARRLGAEPELLVTAGDSAGGQLAASVAIARRDAGLTVAAQLLLYPVIDAAGRYRDAQVNAAYPSRARFADGPGLTLDGMADFAELYLDASGPAGGSDAYDAYDWRVSPIRAEDLTGVAPAIVHTATIDVLSSEGGRYAEALRRAGVRVVAREFDTLNHSYFSLGGVSMVADSAAAQAAADLRDILGLEGV